MTYKTILTYLDGSPSLSARVTLAANLAKRQDAHLTGVAPVGVAVIPGDAYLSVSSDLLAELQSEMDAKAAEAVEKFETICREMGVDSTESASGRYIPADMVLQRSRYCDLVVIGQADKKVKLTSTTHGFVEQVVLGAGKPVLIVPSTGHCTDGGKRVLLAWDGSREAARAATDAMPILAAADTVEVLVVNAKPASDPKGGRIAGTDIALYLARQGVTVDVRNIHSDIDIGETILSHAADHGADFLVMGAYGHSRVREWILGGVTRTVLESMTVPVLMSH